MVVAKDRAMVATWRRAGVSSSTGTKGLEFARSVKKTADFGTKTRLRTGRACLGEGGEVQRQGKLGKETDNPTAPSVNHSAAAIEGMAGGNKCKVPCKLFTSRNLPLANLARGPPSPQLYSPKATTSARCRWGSPP